MQGLLALVIGGTALAGAGLGSSYVNNLTEAQKTELSKAKVEAVSVLTDEETSFIESLDGKKMRDLTDEERADLREIREKLHEATEELITDPSLLDSLEAHHQEMTAKRAEREASRGTGNGQGYGMHKNNK